MKKKIIYSALITFSFLALNILLIRGNVFANSSYCTTEKTTSAESMTTVEKPTTVEEPITTTAEEPVTTTEKPTVTTEAPDKTTITARIYSTLTSSSVAYKGDGTSSSPFRYLCTINCQIKGSFINMIRGYNADGSKKISNSLSVILEVRTNNSPSGSLLKSVTLYGSQETKKNSDSAWTLDSYINGEEESTTTESCNHKFSKWTTVQKATALKNGYKARVCTKCGKAESATIKKLKAKVTLKKKIITLKKKKSYTLKIKSKTYGDKISKWTSKNKKIATVNLKGKVTGKKKGTTIITLKMKSGAKASCKVKVK